VHSFNQELRFIRFEEGTYESDNDLKWYIVFITDYNRKIIISII